MNVKDFDFELPQELIAQDPLEDRSSSRLLVLDKKTGEIEHRTFRDILSYLRKGDCLVINDTKVIPARLFGVKEGTEAKIEIPVSYTHLGTVIIKVRGTRLALGRRISEGIEIREAADHE